MNKIGFDFDEKNLKRPNLRTKLDIARKDLEVDLLMNYSLEKEKRASQVRKVSFSLLEDLAYPSSRQDETEEEDLFNDLSIEPSYSLENVKRASKVRKVSFSLLEDLANSSPRQDETDLFNDLSMDKKSCNIFEPSYSSESWDVTKKLTLLELFDKFRSVPLSHKKKKSACGPNTSESCPRYERYLQQSVQKEKSRQRDKNPLSMKKISTNVSPLKKSGPKNQGKV